jgi:hypothetical protein
MLEVLYLGKIITLMMHLNSSLYVRHDCSRIFVVFSEYILNPEFQSPHNFLIMRDDFLIEGGFKVKVRKLLHDVA